jgi:hypothetical protein
MCEDRKDGATAAGAGGALAGILSLFASPADDVARLGVRYADDIGRAACVTSADDIGAMFFRSSDDTVAAAQGFSSRGYLDDLRFRTVAPRIVSGECDNFPTTTVDAFDIAIQAATKIGELNNQEDL